MRVPSKTPLFRNKWTACNKSEHRGKIRSALALVERPAKIYRGARRRRTIEISYPGNQSGFVKTPFKLLYNSVEKGNQKWFGLDFVSVTCLILHEEGYYTRDFKTLADHKYDTKFNSTEFSKWKSINFFTVARSCFRALDNFGETKNSVT